MTQRKPANPMAPAVAASLGHRGGVSRRWALKAGAASSFLVFGASACSGKAGRSPGSSAPMGTAGGPSSGGRGGARPIASLADLVAKKAITFTAPSVGGAVVVAVGDNQVAAFSTSCTHQGCTVVFDPTSGNLACPCHGSQFDPRAGGKVVGGPAPRPLPSVPVMINSAGQVVLGP